MTQANTATYRKRQIVVGWPHKPIHLLFETVMDLISCAPLVFPRHIHLLSLEFTVRSRHIAQNHPESIIEQDGLESMLKFRRTQTSQSVDFHPSTKDGHNLSQGTATQENRRQSFFVSSQAGYSKANVVLKNVSIPLAWPAEEYFGNTKEWREFTVQLVIRTSEGKETFSKPRESINRTYTDVDFNDVFFFADQSPEFCFEVILYCKRTDVNANPNMMQTLSRSLGRSIGTSLKKYIRSANNTFSGASRLYPDDNAKNSQLSNGPVYRTEHNLDVGSIDADFLENYRNPEKMCALGTGRFRLRNATLSGRTHTYNLELVPHGTYPGVTRSQLLPVYGNICAQLLVQPTSLCGPLAQGQLDMFFVEGGILLQRMFCVLQGSLLKCYNDYGNDEYDKSTSELSKVPLTAKQPPALTLQINKECTVEATAFQTALRLKLCDTNQNTARHFLCIANTHGAYLGWKNAFNLQILDSKIWADFASSQKNPHGSAICPPLSTGASNVLSGLPRYFNDGNDNVQRRSQNPSSTLPISNINRFSSLGKYDHKSTVRNTYATVSEQTNPQIPQTSSVPYNYFGTASKTHYQKSPSVQRRQRRPIPIPEYFQAKEACTTFPAEDQPASSDYTSVPENTYVISLRIGMDTSTPSTPAGATPRRFSCNSSSATANSSVHSTNRGGVSASSSASSSRKNRTSVAFVPTSADRPWDTPPGGQERLLQGTSWLPRARLIGRTKDGKSREDMIGSDNIFRQGRSATVARAETWHVPNLAIQCTRL